MECCDIFVFNIFGTFQLQHRSPLRAGLIPVVNRIYWYAFFRAAPDTAWHVQYRVANPAPYVNSGVYWVAHPGCQCRHQALLGWYIMMLRLVEPPLSRLQQHCWNLCFDRDRSMVKTIASARAKGPTCAAPTHPAAEETDVHLVLGTS